MSSRRLCPPPQEIRSQLRHKPPLARRLLAAALWLLLPTALPIWAEDDPPDGPPMPPPPPRWLSSWLLNDPPLWQTYGTGYGPLASSNVQAPASWLGSSVRLAGSEPAFLAYNWKNGTNGIRNFALPSGAFMFWISPRWSSQPLGTGPGGSENARLIEAGRYTPDASVGHLALWVNSTGDRIGFSGQDNQGNSMEYLSAPIIWESNSWHFIVLNYTRTNCALFVDTEWLTNSPNGVLYYPSPSVLSNGWFLGSSSAGSNLANADFQYLRTFSAPAPDWSFTNSYPLVMTNWILPWQGQQQAGATSNGHELSQGGLPADSSSQMGRQAADGQSLSVGIAYDPPSGFLFDIFNMTPGGFYGIGAKNTLAPNPFNTWSLVSVFQAQASDEELSGTMSGPFRFYTAVNLDAYAGPSVSIVSPVSGATVSGDVALQVAVTDILPLLGVNVYVGGVQVGAIQSGQNGTMTLPTSWFPNGDHEIWVEVVNEGVPVDTDGDTIADDVATFQGWASVTLNFANGVSMQNYSPLYSVAGSITLQYSAATPQDYTFEVFRLNGDLLSTTSGQSANGSMNPQWNFTDLSGNPVNDGGYEFSLTYSPHSGGQGGAAAAAKKIITTNFVDHGVDVGKYVLSYGEFPNSSLNSGLASLSRTVSIGVNSAAYYDDDKIGSGRDAYGIIHADFSSDPFAIRKATQTTDLTALKNALNDPIVGSWLFEGHSGPVNLIHGTDNYLTVDLTAKDVAALLGNDYGFIPGLAFSVKYGRRLFSTMITGCSAATGASEYPDATGTPPGVDQAANLQIKKSAFLGFTQLSNAGSTKFNWIAYIHSDWLDGEDYDTDISSSVWRANLAYPAVQNWGPTLFGYGFLEYSANESR